MIVLALPLVARDASNARDACNADVAQSDCCVACPAAGRMLRRHAAGRADPRLGDEPAGAGTRAIPGTVRRGAAQEAAGGASTGAERFDGVGECAGDGWDRRADRATYA